MKKLKVLINLLQSKIKIEQIAIAALEERINTNKILVQSLYEKLHNMIPSPTFPSQSFIASSMENIDTLNKANHDLESISSIHLNTINNLMIEKKQIELLLKKKELEYFDTMNKQSIRAIDELVSQNPHSKSIK